MSELYIALDAAYEQQEAIQERFEITDLSSANWAVRKIAAARKKVEQRKAEAQAEIEKIEDWAEKANADDLETIAYMESLLRSFTAKQIVGSKKKSISLPGATLGFTTQQPEYERDDEQTLAWAGLAGLEQYIRTEPKLRWTELKDNCVAVDGHLIYRPTGEIVPGVTPKERPDKFTVKLKGE